MSRQCCHLHASCALLIRDDCAAKNVILAGVKAVTIHDTADVRIQDLSAQFYLSEASVGANRASACKDKLQELNTAVAVSASTADLTEQFISQYQVSRLWLTKFDLNA